MYVPIISPAYKITMQLSMICYHLQVNMKFLGKSFLHIAISAGQVHIMKLLLQYTPNMDMVSA